MIKELEDRLAELKDILHNLKAKTPNDHTFDYSQMQVYILGFNDAVEIIKKHHNDIGDKNKMGFLNDETGLYTINITGEQLVGEQRIVVTHKDIGCLLDYYVYGTIEEADSYARGYIASHREWDDISKNAPKIQNNATAATAANMRSFSAAVTLGFAHGSIGTILLGNPDSIRINLVKLMQELDKRISKLCYDEDIAKP